MFVRPDPHSGGYLRHPVAACTTVHSTVSLHVLGSNSWGSRSRFFPRCTSVASWTGYSLEWTPSGVWCGRKCL